MNHHEFYEQVYGPSEAEHAGKPRGWIQWKGTAVCIDLHCDCGEHGHIDAEFFYHYECKCGKKYAVSHDVKLIPLTAEQIAYVEQTSVGFLKDESDDYET